MISQLTLTTHKHMLRAYTNTFTSEEAIRQLGSLKFSKMDDSCNFASRITTTFNMRKDMAKALLQQFLWTRLIENASEPQNRSYRDKGIWKIRSKGLCVLQNFCLKTKMDISTFKKHVDINAVPLYLINLERMQSNDRINRNRKYTSCLFTIMIASLPLRSNNREKQVDLQHYIYPSHGNPDIEPITLDALKELGIHSALEVSRTSSIYSSDSSSIDTYAKPSKRNLTITDFFPNIEILPNDLLVDTEYGNRVYYQQQQSLINNLSPSYSNKFKMRAIFSSQLCCNWLVEYCTIASNDEAETVMTEFLKLGWITFFDKKNEHLQEVEASKTNILKLTKTGMDVIINISLNQHNMMKVLAKTNAVSSRCSSISSPCDNMIGTSSSPAVSFFDEKERDTDSPMQTPPLTTNINDYCSTYTPDITSSETFTPPLTPIAPTNELKESNSSKLKAVLKDPHLRSLFRNFLSSNFCQENLDFWIDYDNLCRRCNSPAFLPSANQRLLLEDAYLLWDSYLKPGALYELNIEHNLREEMAEEISHTVNVIHTAGQSKPTIVVSAHSVYQSLLIILKWFGKVNDHICKLMATDSIPKFVKTSKYKRATTNSQFISVPFELKDFPHPPSRQETK